MRIFITRHGQIEKAEIINNNPNLPKNDPPISELGKEQAKLLAKEIQRLGFKGKIYSSPFLRTMMTAKYVSKLLNLPIYPCSELREYVPNEECMQGFKGMSLDELKVLFPEIEQDAQLTYPWWKKEIENMEDVKVRVRPFLEQLLKVGEDVLLVGHGASVYATFACLMDMSRQQFSDILPPWYNCSLTQFTYIKGKVIPVCLMGNSHIPTSMLTENGKYALKALE